MLDHFWQKAVFSTHFGLGKNNFITFFHPRFSFSAMQKYRCNLSRKNILYNSLAVFSLPNFFLVFKNLFNFWTKFYPKFYNFIFVFHAILSAFHSHALFSVRLNFPLYPSVKCNERPILSLLTYLLNQTYWH